MTGSRKMCSCRSARWDKAAMRSNRMGLCAEQWQPKTMVIAEQPANRESAIEGASRDHAAGFCLRDSISRPEESNCFLAAQWRVLSK